MFKPSLDNLVADPVGIEVREYQRNISQSALASNTLVVLPTGLGKTIIALLVAIERLSQFPEGKILVLAPTRPLVVQHFDSFAQHLPFRAAMCVLTGEVAPQDRSHLFETSRIVFATPEVIRNDVARQRYSLGIVCLAVFDEAHRCVRDYAYSEVAEEYRRIASAPLILGLTASPSARKARVAEICSKLAITNVEARTEIDSDVTQYVKPVDLKWLKVALPLEYKQLSRVLRSALEERVRKLQTMHQLPIGVPVSKRLLLELGVSLRDKLKRGGGGALFGAVILQAQSMSLLHAVESLETQGVHSLNRVLSRLERANTKSGRNLSRDSRVLEAQKLGLSLENVEHPKLAKLREIVRTELRSKPNSKVIVFTQFRDTAEIIVNRLTRLEGISAVRFVGQATRREEDPGLTQAEQMDILEKFSEGQFNVLVTTSIGEEGLHVPDVDHVIFYEPVPSEIRLIQRRGRTGRTRSGKMTVLIAEGTVDEAYYWSSKRKEEQMHRFLETVKKKGAIPTRKKTTLLDYATAN